jgi:polar amino acid transport system substrate-binding protein
LDNVYAALQAGRADAVLDGLPGVLYFIKGNPGYSQFVATPEDQPVKNTWTVIGVPRDNLDLCNYLNDALTEMKQNGKMKEIQEKWLGGYMETPAEVEEYEVCQ